MSYEKVVAEVIERESPGIVARPADGGGVVSWTDGPSMNEVVAAIRRGGYEVQITSGGAAWPGAHDVTVADGYTVTLMRRMRLDTFIVAVLRAGEMRGPTADVLENILRDVNAGPALIETERITAVIVTDRVGRAQHIITFRTLRQVVHCIGGVGVLCDTARVALAG